jgi:hypothetical protein
VYLRQVELQLKVLPMLRSFAMAREAPYFAEGLLDQGRSPVEREVAIQVLRTNPMREGAFGRMVS